jgi:signal peptidase I
MCIPYDGACDGWTSINHPFAPTMHKGDIIIIQGVDPKTLNADYPNSDIIVFHRPDNPSELVVHRIISEEVREGKIYFLTKGDGNNPPDTWPNPPAYHDPWGEVSQDLVVGKVIMRIPWIGWITIGMQELGVSGTATVVPLIVILIILAIIVEFVVPLLRNKRKLAQQNTPPSSDAEAAVKKSHNQSTRYRHKSLT